MIVEGLLTSTNTDGDVNVAPMGPIVHGDFVSLTLRPFAGSTTFRNLLATGVGVFHVVDRVNLIAEAAIGRLSKLPQMTPSVRIPGYVLNDCCRWFEFQITDINTRSERSEMQAKIVHQQQRRSFFGFNRARHAVIEAAILATRVHLLSAEEVQVPFRFLRSAVQKTGGPEEQAAFRILDEHVQKHHAGVASA